ncbi:MAG: tripartite tricarboxylate transporter TctB family protein [Gordonia sp. (in: high G+C Gram-positive bacteria)]
MSDKSESPTTGAPARDLGALVIPAVLVVVGVLLVSGIVTMDVAGEGGLFGPQMFPWVVAVLCFVVAAAMTVTIVRPAPPPETADPGDEVDAILDAEPEQVASNWRSVGIVVGGVVLFIVLLEPVGWLISATLLFAIVAFGLGARNHLASLLGGLGMASVIQLAFSGFLGIHVPPGILG